MRTKRRDSRRQTRSTGGRQAYRKPAEVVELEKNFVIPGTDLMAEPGDKIEIYPRKEKKPGA